MERDSNSQRPRRTPALQADATNRICLPCMAESGGVEPLWLITIPRFSRPFASPTQRHFPKFQRNPFHLFTIQFLGHSQNRITGQYHHAPWYPRICIQPFLSIPLAPEWRREWVLTPRGPCGSSSLANCSFYRSRISPYLVGEVALRYTTAFAGNT